MSSGHCSLLHPGQSTRYLQQPMVAAHTLPKLISPSPQRVCKGVLGTSFPGEQRTGSVVPRKCPINSRSTETKGQGGTIPLSLSSLGHKLPEGHSCTAQQSLDPSSPPSGDTARVHTAEKMAWPAESLPAWVLELLLLLGTAPSALPNPRTSQQGLFFTLKGITKLPYVLLPAGREMSPSAFSQGRHLCSGGRWQP